MHRLEQDESGEPEPPKAPPRNNFAIPLLALLATLLFPKAAPAGVPEFFVFDNGVGRGLWTPEQQAVTLKELGYEGISYNYTKPEDLAVWQQTFGRHGLKIYGLYVTTALDKPVPYSPGVKEAIKLLKDSGTVLWVMILPPKAKGDYQAQAVRLIQDLADQAQASGVRVAIYPHAGCYVATAVQAVQLVKEVQRQNVGASLNLCHEFLSGNDGRMEQTIPMVAPCVTLVSINGIDVKSKQYLLRLDQGDYDVAAWLKKLQAAGYKGPVGLQCYSVKGDVRENLKADIAAWRKLAAQLEAP